MGRVEVWTPRDRFVYDCLTYQIEIFLLLLLLFAFY